MDPTFSDSQSEKSFSIETVSGEGRSSRDDLLAVEEPMEIRLVSGPPERRKGRALSITMRTPGHDLELAAGFLFTEGIISSGDQIAGFERCGPIDKSRGEANTIRIELAHGVELDTSKLQRHFYTTSSCGVCGKTSLDAVRDLGIESLPDTGLRLDAAFVNGAGTELAKHQQAFRQSGGVHAAGLFGTDKKLLAIREDVGRHNALDKLIGSQILSDGVPLHGCAVMVSGRSSFELVQKTISAGAEALICVGPPSSLAVEMAIEFNLTLVGFATGNRFNIYSAGYRIR